MTKSQAIKRAEQDYRLKLRLERSLAKTMVRHFNGLTRDAKKHYIKSGQTLFLSANWLSVFVGSLNRHYNKVANVFKKRLELRGIELTQDEVQRLETAIKRDASNRAFYASTAIINHLQEGLGQSFITAKNQAIASDKPFTDKKIASIASSDFKRKTRYRAVSTIPITETQNAAERTKRDVFTTHHTADTKSKIGIGRAIFQATKSWHTVGDSKVREEHADANLQIKPLNNPFDVGGEQLMQPGDTSLGASPGNTINCRCSAQYSLI